MAVCVCLGWLCTVTVVCGCGDCVSMPHVYQSEEPVCIYVYIYVCLLVVAEYVLCQSAMAVYIYAWYVCASVSAVCPCVIK